MDTGLAVVDTGHSFQEDVGSNNRSKAVRKAASKARNEGLANNSGPEQAGAVAG